MPGDPEAPAGKYGKEKVMGVAEELQKGYMYKDTILRHSMVKVAN